MLTCVVGVPHWPAERGEHPELFVDEGPRAADSRSAMGPQLRLQGSELDLPGLLGGFPACLLLGTASSCPPAPSQRALASVSRDPMKSSEWLQIDLSTLMPTPQTMWMKAAALAHRLDRV